ncbi:short transient receptor potential channel 7-like isoform X4 [Lineus longissimus]|uniref:short transient receptor potential channel 7-like isoform X4 n=1 Tax=Lineus longissimus TaxID=88925 RepID=UPI00315DD2D9
MANNVEEDIITPTKAANVNVAMRGGILASLSDEECVYLNAAELGEIDIVRECLEKPELNVNCLDYMGRNALILAINNENLDLIDLLLDRLNFCAIEDALLHAISKCKVTIVKLIIDHDQYLAGEANRDSLTGERSQFSPDITPLILAAHYNSHEVIQMFLSREHTIEKPHTVLCKCDECETGRSIDRLEFERSRLNKYKAFASPAYMALANNDPISAVFELRQDLRTMAEYQQEFKNDYEVLVQQCMEFACDILDLCRSGREVDALMTCEYGPEGEPKVTDPLGTLRIAMAYEEKKFVSHPNCQHQISLLYYGEAIFLQEWSVLKQFLHLLLILPLLPVLCIIYIINPEAKFLRYLRCPVVKFINSTFSYVVFLALLTVATFTRDVEIPEGDTTDLNWEAKAKVLFKYDFRNEVHLISNVQILLIFWIVGQFVIEIKQVYISGLKDYFSNLYNFVDSAGISIYIASYVLRLITEYKVRNVAQQYASNITRCKQIMFNQTLFYDSDIAFEYQIITSQLFDIEGTYYLRGTRLWWNTYDPQIVSDCLFAIANIMSFVRVTYIMAAFENLGPLQLSLGRMIGDIGRFMTLFILVGFAFVVGLTNLYNNYSLILISWEKNEGPSGKMEMGTTIEGFRAIGSTTATLFWSLFGMVDKEVVEIDDHNVHIGNKIYMKNPESTTMITTIGTMLLGLYCAVMIIILLNMLIAMMSQSFEDIQSSADEEWKFARTNLWMSYVQETGTLPSPFNLIPTKKNILSWYYFLSGLFRCHEKEEDDGKEEEELEMAHADEDARRELRKNLVRRYLFKLQREVENVKQDSTIRPDDPEPPPQTSPPPTHTEIGEGGGKPFELPPFGDFPLRKKQSKVRRRLLMGNRPPAGERRLSKVPEPTPAPEPEPEPEPPVLRIPLAQQEAVPAVLEMDDDVPLEMPYDRDMGIPASMMRGRNPMNPDCKYV